MARGKIKFFNPRKGFGFIIATDGEGEDRDFYFPREALPRDRRFDPVEGDVVEFTTREAEKGPMAVRIEFVDEAQG